MSEEIVFEPRLIIETASTVAQSINLHSDVVPNILSTPESLRMPMLILNLNSPDMWMFTLEEDSIRLLHANVRWALSVPAFRALSRDTQLTILKLRWTELMVLGLLMFSTELVLVDVLPRIMIFLEKSYDLYMNQEISGVVASAFCMSNTDPKVREDRNNRLKNVRLLLGRLLNLIKVFNSLLVSDPEYAYLRAMCLFSPVGAPEELEQQLGELQFQVLQSLRTVCQSDELRMVSLLTRVSFVKKFPAQYLKIALKLDKCETLDTMLDQECNRVVEETTAVHSI